jgi:hypothetical protein
MLPQALSLYVLTTYSPLSHVIAAELVLLGYHFMEPQIFLPFRTLFDRWHTLVLIPVIVFPLLRELADELLCIGFLLLFYAWQYSHLWIGIGVCGLVVSATLIGNSKKLYSIPVTFLFSSMMFWLECSDRDIFWLVTCGLCASSIILFGLQKRENRKIAVRNLGFLVFEFLSHFGYGFWTEFGISFFVQFLSILIDAYGFGKTNKELKKD